MIKLDDESELYIITVQALRGLWCFNTALWMCLSRLSTLTKEHALSIFYTINQENTEIFYWGRNLQGRTRKGPKPLGPNWKRAETSGIHPGRVLLSLTSYVRYVICWHFKTEIDPFCTVIFRKCKLKVRIYRNDW